MKLFVREIFASLLACMIFAGCASSPNSDPIFSDNPAPPPTVTGSPSAGNLADVARFHVGETVIITFSGLPADDPLQAQSHDYPIKEDGNITLPYIGAIQAAGKTAGELQAEIYGLYVPKYYIRLTATVKPGDLIYYVTGEVKNPGREIYVGETTVTKAITSAGGFTDFANHSKVYLVRANGERVRVNADKAMEHPADDLQIYPGDQIEVKRRIF
jgi:polysaccharide export outer membrane protein